MPEPTPSPPRPGRRRFTLSLRALMVLVLVVGGLMGWKARRASIQRRAVEAITATGGSVSYDYQKQGGTWKPNAPHWAPGWLRGPIGDEYFQEPVGVFLGNRTPTGGSRPVVPTLEAVARLDQVEFIHSRNCPIDDAGFARLAVMPHLSDIYLGEVDVTDEGLASLGHLPSLGRAGAP